ncbi:uncharacterized protein N7525_008815 [Penicillium rubens]|uniref:uncharacterized protein n=1 Tax=Penicillium rubens TaxID=1108849 RepID=UPI002A599533|nr:uncharacterized protein N7525_008815 [Penicillium rubens]KAJ5830562.1 hypothetical protein N7525_008815 [Penicillium rubens]
MAVHFLFKAFILLSEVFNILFKALLLTLKVILFTRKSALRRSSLVPRPSDTSSTSPMYRLKRRRPGPSLTRGQNKIDWAVRGVGIRVCGGVKRTEGQLCQGIPQAGLDSGRWS